MAFYCLRCFDPACKRAVSGILPHPVESAASTHWIQLRSPSLAHARVVLVRTTHPGNIGAAARAMYTMGLTRLVLVAPYHFPHPDADAMATGATAVLAEARTVATLHEALAGCALAVGLSARPRAFAGRVLSIRDAAREASRAARTAKLRSCSARRCPGCPTTSSRNAGSLPPFPPIPSTRPSISPRRCRSRRTNCEWRPAAMRVWRAPRFAAATHDEVEALHAHARGHAGRDALPESGAPQAPHGRGCGACSAAPGSSGRKSTSCAASSRASTS